MIIKAIRLTAIVVIGYCVIQLARDPAVDGLKTYTCAFGDDFTEKYDIEAPSVHDAKHKLLMMQPDTIHDIECQEKK